MNTAMNNHVKAIDAVAVALVALVLSCMIKDVSSQLDVEFLEPLAAVVNGVTFNLTCKFQYDNDDDIAAMKWEISDKNLERRLDESANQLTDDLLTRHSNGTFSGPGSPRMTSMKLQDGSFQLSVSDVDFTTDEKRYWCYAFVYSRTGGENYHDLNVSVPANSEDVSVYIDGKEITSPSTTLSKQQHEARCEVKGVRPKPLITWSGINEQDSDQNYTVNKENNLLWDSISTVDFTVAKTVILKLTVAVPGEGGIFEKTITLDVQEPTTTVEPTTADSTTAEPITLTKTSVKQAPTDATSARPTEDLDAVLVVEGTYTDALADQQSSAFQDLQTTMMTGMATIDGVAGTMDYSFSSGSIKASFTIQLEPNTDLTTEKLEMEIETAFSNGAFTDLTFISAEVTDTKVTDTNTKSGTQNDKNIPVYIGLGVGVPVLIIVACIIALIVWKIMTKNKVKPDEKKKDERKEN